MSDSISREEAKKEVYLLGKNPSVNEIWDCLDELPSAEAVDCTDFIEWLVDRVLDETIWEYNSVAYGEIICRKLEKLGILEVTEEPSYYIRPSADAVQGWRTGKPTKQGEYTVTVKSMRGGMVESLYYGKPIMPNRKVKGKCWYRSDDEWGDVVYDDTDILAWQPLPTPYKGGDSE